MSRAFLKDDTSGDQPIIPPRAALPAGHTNYVTPAGLEQLRAERTNLEIERAVVEANRDNDADRSWQLTILNGKLAALNDRISSAKVVDTKSQSTDVVRFGAQVELKTVSEINTGLIRKFRIVGVDEASVAEGKVAFIAPIAKAIQGKKVGDLVVLHLGPREELVEVTRIDYDAT